MKQYALIIILIIALAACRKGGLQPASQPRTSPTQETRHITANHLEIRTAKSIKDTTGNYIKEITLNEFLPIDRSPSFINKAHYRFTDSPSAYSCYLSFSSMIIKEKTVDYNRNGILRITTKSLNDWDFMWSIDKYYFDWFNVPYGDEMTIDFYYGSQTDNLPLPVVMEALNWMINNGTGKGKYN